MKDMEKSVKDAQKAASALRVEASALRSKRDTLAAELKAAQQEFSTIKDQQTICEATIARLTSEIAELEAQVITSRITSVYLLLRVEIKRFALLDPMNSIAECQARAVRKGEASDG